MTLNATKIFTFTTILYLSSCCAINMQELEVLENPFENDIDVHISTSNNNNSHEILRYFDDTIEKSRKYKPNQQTLELSYNVLNNDKNMDTFYGYIMYIPVYASLGLFCLTGWPIDFMSQSINMKAELYDKDNNLIKKYTGEGYSYKTVACYYGYSPTDARKLANSLAYNEALEEIYEQIDDDIKIMKQKMLSEKDYKKIISKLIDKFKKTDTILNKDEIILSISEITSDSRLVEKELFLKKLRTAFVQTDKVKIATYTEDETVMDTRELRKSEEVDQKTVAQKNSLLAPNMALKSEIIVREDDDDDVEYFFYLTLTDIETGLIVIELEESIKK